MFEIKPGELTYPDIRNFFHNHQQIFLSENTHAAIFAAEKTIANVMANGKIVYGINTGFGSLANKRISEDDVLTLQQSLVLSHAAGTGELLSDDIVRLMLLLKINSLAQGYSGVRLQLIEALIQLFNAEVYPCVPAKGSVGASGDLAPLAHLCTTLLGVGTCRFEKNIFSSEKGLEIANLSALELAPKEGLSLINGTQTSTAIALQALIQCEKIFIAALIAGAMSVDATLRSDVPFDDRIQQIRRHPTQIFVAKILRELLAESRIRASHLDCPKVQDPYSLRCQPQVMGACLAQMIFAKDVLIHEANGVSDNPLVFSDDSQILSGGNFHAEPVAMAADNLALAISEIGALSERRIALLIDPQISDLPAFLVENSGVNSGFMIPQVTAAALASENKSLAHPASVDSIPTSNNQEDHVSMATFAANRLLTMIENTCGIVAIELLAACQGIDFRRPLQSSQVLEQVHALIRDKVSYYKKDRFFAPDIEAVKKIILSEQLQQLTAISIFS